MGTFGNPGGGPGGGNPPGGGVFNAPLDSWMFILIALGIVVFLLLRRKELQQHKQ
jgi:hypothetical protein